MFKMLLLICATGVSPGDCQIDTAIDVIQGPVTASAAACAFQGQAQLADTALPIRPGETYLKVRCAREAAAALGDIQPGAPPAGAVAAPALYR
ncbi:hypothetical protein [Inquilinus sp. OTU3971]|uniref:hypothetical protein n=1 Tax=Inquilinus sp. OTU3971 TaxID=3043855 RepID=UPI00313E65BA